MIKRKICELYAMDVSILPDGTTSIKVTRISNVGAFGLQDIINAAPEAHKEVIMDLDDLQKDDRVSLNLKWSS